MDGIADGMNIDFRYILNEISYGATQTDNRFIPIKDILKNELRKMLNDNRSEGAIFFKSSKKIKSISNIICIMELNIVFEKELNPVYLIRRCSMSRVETDGGIYKCSFTIYCTIPFNAIEEDYYKKILVLLENNRLDGSILHEIKHTLDQIDGIQDFKYYKSADYNSDDREMSDYVSQDSERDSQLINVIEDLRYIHDKYPDISYKDALNKSSVYSKFVKYMSPIKFKKYRAKLVHFWETIKGEF